MASLLSGAAGLSEIAAKIAAIPTKLTEGKTAIKAEVEALVDRKLADAGAATPPTNVGNGSNAGNGSYEEGNGSYEEGNGSNVGNGSNAGNGSYEGNYSNAGNGSNAGYEGGGGARRKRTRRSKRKGHKSRKNMKRKTRKGKGKNRRVRYNGK
jgi:hypothetical protein